MITFVRNTRPICLCFSNIFLRSVLYVDSDYVDECSNAHKRKHLVSFQKMYYMRAPHPLWVSAHNVHPCLPDAYYSNYVLNIVWILKRFLASCSFMASVSFLIRVSNEYILRRGFMGFVHKRKRQFLFSLFIISSFKHWSTADAFPNSIFDDAVEGHNEWMYAT